MTTRVKIEVVEEHMPVLVSKTTNEGTLIPGVQVLRQKGDSVEIYVYGNQRIVVSEAGDFS